MTLIEIMIVVAIIGVMMSGVAVMAFQRYKAAQVRQARVDVRNAESALQHFALDSQNCPTGWAALVEQKILEKAPKDPWGEELVFTCPGQQNVDGSDVVSKGPDKRDGTQDDIRSWEL